MTEPAFFFDQTRCTGCKTCEMACKDYKGLGVGLAYRKVYEVTYGQTRKTPDGYISSNCKSYSVSMSCNHCGNPACVHVCPTTAMHKDEHGIVSVDTTKCIGCGYCHMACPYNAPKINPRTGQSAKCDACKERLSEGLKPVCVEACPARALDFGALSEIAPRGEMAQIAPLPRPSFTEPSLFIKPSPDALISGSPEGVVANPLEVL